MKNSLAKTIEIIWLITSLLCLVTAIHQTFLEGITKSYIFFIFSFIAFAMHLLRKNMRKSNKTNKERKRILKKETNLSSLAVGLEFPT